MALSFANRHIINRIRLLIDDKNDVNLSFEDKVLLINSALSEYSDGIFNYRKTTLSVEDDGITYKLPSDFEKASIVNYKNTGTILKEDIDYVISDGKLVLNLLGYTNSIHNAGSNQLDILYDAYVKFLHQEIIGEYEAGNNVSITVRNSSNFNVGEYVMIKDVGEQVIEIKTIPNANTIVLDLLSDITSNAYITGNVNIPEQDYSIIDEYCRYKNMTIKTSDGKTLENALAIFYKRISNHKNSKNKKFNGFQTISLSKT